MSDKERHAHQESVTIAGKHYLVWVLPASESSWRVYGDFRGRSFSHTANSPGEALSMWRHDADSASKARKRSNRVKLFFALLLLLCVISVAGIPMQEKLVCEFEAGDRMIIRQNYLFVPVGLVVRTVASSEFYTEGSNVFYKPRYGLEEWESVAGYGPIETGFEDPKIREGYCSKFQKKGNLISTGPMYKLPGEDWQDTPYRKGFFNVEASGLNKKIQEMGLFYGRFGMNIVRLDGSTLLFEQELTSGKNSPDNIVRAVLQSYSYDNGQTWKPLVLTRDSKLYELGKPVLEQNEVARPVDWTGKPWFGDEPEPEPKPNVCPKRQRPSTNCAEG